MMCEKKRIKEKKGEEKKKKKNVSLKRKKEREKKNGGEKKCLKVKIPKNLYILRNFELQKPFFLAKIRAYNTTKESPNRSQVKLVIVWREDE